MLFAPRSRLAATFAALAIAATLLACASPSSPSKRISPVPSPVSGIPDASLGLEKSPVTGVPAPKPFEYVTKDPGDGRVLPRPFDAAPPLIPHTVDGLLPITRTDNGCLTCHAVDKAEPGGPVPIPASHYVDTRNAPAVKRTEIAGGRYVCTACHVPQTNAKPLTGNLFTR